MKLSKSHISTLREVPGEAEIPSHIWLLRAGMIKKMASGVYGFMTMGWRTVRKIEQIVREEMDAAGAQEISFSPLQPAELWRESGRWSVYGPEMWRTKDRHGREFCLGPTAEEVVTDIVRNDVTSHKQLPLNLYQFQLKYRDEARPRYGLMRCREFIMKDAYSFDRDQVGLDESYKKMFDAYDRVFDRCGLDFRPVYADNGAIGGSESQEFTALCEYGESDILYCSECDFAATAEQADAVDEKTSPEDMLPLEEVLTPDMKTIEEVAGFLEIAKDRTMKALLFAVYENSEDLGRDEEGEASTEYEVREYVAAFIRGDRELNMTKLMNALGVAEHMIGFADEAAMGKVTGSVAGYTGPIGLHDCRIIADSELTDMPNLVAGACKHEYHIKNVNYGRDYTADIVTDIKLVQEGEPCPNCGKPLKKARGIEVGQVFKLGTKYSESMNAMYKDENMEDQLILMGCYGIGVTRTMAAIVEQSHDDKGIIWPMSVTPYHVIITLAKSDDEAAAGMAEEIYDALNEKGIETILDDRPERAGVKFNDADIFGIPIRITVGKKAIDGIVEYKLRSESASEDLTVFEAVEKAVYKVKAEMHG